MIRVGKVHLSHMGLGFTYCVMILVLFIRLDDVCVYNVCLSLQMGPPTETTSRQLSKMLSGTRQVMFLCYVNCQCMCVCCVQPLTKLCVKCI